MNRLLDWLAGGDIRSDGLSAEVIRFVLEDPSLVGDLMSGLTVESDVIRGRAADAIEHIARAIPVKLLPYREAIEHALIDDPVPMVRWHMAMVMGHMALDWEDPASASAILCGCLQDSSVFVVSWVIVSLCIYAKIYPAQLEAIVCEIVTLQTNPSVAIRSKVKNAMHLLSNQQQLFPKGWVKSESIASDLLVRQGGKT
jgi:hypothetical protein